MVDAVRDGADSLLRTYLRAKRGLQMFAGAGRGVAEVPVLRLKPRN